jgi:light-regulated signal transduction histidine kinase (bacteriophytochrome)
MIVMKTVRPTLRVQLQELLAENVRLTSRATQAEQERDTAIQEARRAQLEMDQMFYAASHDLQEPLRSIISYAQLLRLRLDAKDVEATEFVGYVLGGANRMAALVRDMLVYTRVAPPKLVAVSLESVLEGILLNLQKEIAESGAKITHDPLPEVNGDPIQLSQLIQQLIGNALKFRSQLPALVHLSVEEEDGEVVVSVRDNGPGIEPRFHEQVFVMFKRLHGRDIAGNGIGLALCRRIAQGHGGRIWVESDGQSGSTFRFSLPR